MTVVIRPITQSDLPELANGYVNAFRTSEEPWTSKTAYGLLANWLHRQPDLAFVAAVGDSLAGALFVGIRPWCDGNHLVDGEMFVIPEFQNMGIATQLLQSMLRVAVPKYNPIVWETYTFRDHKFPLEWYQRLGFREIQEWMMIRANVDDLRIAMAD